MSTRESYEVVELVPEHQVADNAALVAALGEADFCRRDLQAALASANAVEALVLLPLIAKAAELAAGIMNLKAAMEQQP